MSQPDEPLKETIEFVKPPGPLDFIDKEYDNFFSDPSKVPDFDWDKDHFEETTKSPVKVEDVPFDLDVISAREMEILKSDSN